MNTKVSVFVFCVEAIIYIYISYYIICMTVTFKFPNAKIEQKEV